MTTRDILDLESSYAGDVLTEQLRMRCLGDINRMSDQEVCDLVRDVRYEQRAQDEEEPDGAAFVLTALFVAGLLIIAGVVLWRS